MAAIKSLESFAGKGVWKAIRGEETYRTLLDDATRQGNHAVMVQAFLSEVARGEKRVFVLDGKPLGAILKIPPDGRFLTNPDLGGRLAPADLTRREKKILAELAPFLQKNGIFFAGIDLIGERLTEINLTSPGLLWEWNEVSNGRHEEEIADGIERKLR